MNSSRVEEALKSLQAQDGVDGVIIVNNDGVPINSTMDNKTSIKYAGLMLQIIGISRSSIKINEPSNDLEFLRIRTKKNEIIIIPEKHYSMMVVQTPTGTKSPL